MAAYGSIVSLLQILDQALKSDQPNWIEHCEKQQIESLCEELESLQTIFDNSAGRRIHTDRAETERLESQIRDAVMEAEDAIETFIADWREKKNKDDNTFRLRLSELINEIDILTAQLSDSVLNVNSLHNRPPSSASSGGTSRPLSHLHDDIVIGFDHDMEKLRSLLLSKSKELQVVAIEGTGGIGKTTLAQTLYKDANITLHFDVRAWTTVSQEYNVTEMLRTLLTCFTTGRIESMDCSELAHKLQKDLKGLRYLIVLDDIWEVDAWELLMPCLPDYCNRSRILITTRISGVANHICSKVLIHRLPLLKTEESWTLLCEKVFLGKGCPPDLEETGMEIAKRCGGLRIAVVVIAGLLRNIDLTKEEWYRVAENLNSIITHDVEGCMSALALSYKNLPHHLKPCFLYMGIFPEDFEISKWRLIRLWVAEGFLRTEKDRILEEVAEIFLKELVDRNLILIARTSTSDGKMQTCKMHDLLRELSLREAKKDKFLQDCRKPADHFNIESTITAPRVLVSFELPQNVFMHLPRSITSHSRGIIDFDYSYRLLRVLNWELPADHMYSSMKKYMRKFLNLRYLHLRFVDELPESINNLVDLQTLMISYPISSFEVQNWWKMSRLRHLCISGLLEYSFILPSPPNEIEGHNSLVLGNLQALLGIHPSSCTQRVFQRTPNLKELVVHDCGCDIFKSECQHVQHCLNSFGYLSNLEYLNLRFFPRVCFSIPRLSSSLSQKLKKLSLSGCTLPWEDIRMLGMLPNLEVLKLKTNAFLGSNWEPKPGGFDQLKFLLLDLTFPTENWLDVEAPFPRLEHLVLKHWNETEAKIPRSIGEIQTLECIELHWCKPSIVASAMIIQRDREELGDYDLHVVIKDKKEAPKSDHVSDWISHHEKEQIQSLHEKLVALQTIFDDSAANLIYKNEVKMEFLEVQIRDALMEAEDAIETHIAHWRVKDGQFDEKKQKIFHQGLSRLIKEIHSLMAKLRSFIRSNHKQPPEDTT